MVNKKQSITDHTKSIAGKHRLSEQQLDQLHRLMSDSQDYEAEAPKKSVNRFGSYSAIAASLFLVCAISMYTVFNYQQDKHADTVVGAFPDVDKNGLSVNVQAGENIFMQIANEVSYNHTNLKPMEVSSDTFATVANYFSNLEFFPRSTSNLSNASLRLVGGRYCSIKGSSAAQLRYVDAGGKLTTLFETNYDATKFQGLPVIENGEEPVEVYARGYKVDIWVEKGLVMATVQKP